MEFIFSMRLAWGDKGRRKVSEYINEPDDYDTTKAEQLRRELDRQNVSDAKIVSDRKILEGHWPLAKNSLKSRVLKRVEDINRKAKADVMSAKDVGAKLIVANEVTKKKCAVMFNDITHAVLLDGGYSFPFKVNGADSGSFFQSETEISIDALIEIVINIVTPQDV
jgi:hypothetical protein